MDGNTIVAPRRRIAQREGTFIDNMRMPIHRWFRYSAGFSADWVSRVLSTRGAQKDRVLDPFSGSCTTLIASEMFGCESVGFEPHSFIHSIGSAKLAWKSNPTKFLQAAECTIAYAKKHVAPPRKKGGNLMERCFTAENLQNLDRLRNAFEQIGNRHDDEWRLVWLAINSSLRPSSSVGTAQWQYLLPAVEKRRVRCALDVFRAAVDMIHSDMASVQGLWTGPKSTLYLHDARADPPTNCTDFTLVITSPPYPNNYDYADATRLELVFWEEIDRWADLQGHVRKHLLHSCTQHVSAEHIELDHLLRDNCLDPIRDEISGVCHRLAKMREERLGKKDYHIMVAAYFVDLACVWNQLRKVCARGADVCFVVGDSAPYGVHVPTEQWLARLAIASGFEDPRFEKLRDRNVKWKNRKHRVPLQEGRLWVRG